MKVRLILAGVVSVLLGSFTLLALLFLSGYSKDLAIFAYPLPLGFLLISGSDDYVTLTGAIQFLVEGVALAVPETRINRLKVLACISSIHLVAWLILRLY